MKPTTRLLAFGIVTAASIAAAATENSPYKVIATRNVFGLVEKPPVKIDQPPPPALPQITVQGITSILGRPQALLKVAFPAKPGEPARELSDILNEGDQANEVHVLSIDFKGGTVRVTNHGTEQTLALQRTPQSPAAATTPATVALATTQSPGPTRNATEALKELRAKLRQDPR